MIYLHFWEKKSLIDVNTESKCLSSTLRSWLHKISTRIRIFSPGLENIVTLKCWSGILPWTLIYMMMLENCQTNISMYGCSPIQGEKIMILVEILWSQDLRVEHYTTVHHFHYRKTPQTLVMWNSLELYKFQGNWALSCVPLVM